jgi:uncharacterized membrane-anchored protein YhcB (DUF1043 family)
MVAWWYVPVALVVGVLLGVLILALCCVSKRADVDQEWIDRQGRVDR